MLFRSEAEVSQGEEADYQKTPSKYDRSEPPLSDPPALKVPEIWSNTTANGIEVIGIEDVEVPLVTFSLVIPGVQWLDSPGRIGAASLLARLSMQGTRDRTPAELEEAIGLLGATIQVSSGMEALTLTATTLERNLEATIALVEEILQIGRAHV